MTYFVVVFSAEVHGVHVHAPVISPVVGERDQKLDTSLFGSLDNFVKAGQVNGGGAIGIPPLEDDLRWTSTFPSVLRKAIGNVRLVFVIETPCPEHRETGILGSRQPVFDVLLILLPC